MTEVTFHFNVADRQQYLCRLLRKAWQRQARVLVHAPVAELAAIDALLWTTADDFVPHARWDDPPMIQSRSPILLTPDWPAEVTHPVLVNGMDSVPAGYARHARVIEVIGLSDAERQLGRQRWKHYVDAGLSPSRHDAAAPAPIAAGAPSADSVHD